MNNKQYAILKSCIKCPVSFGKLLEIHDLTYEQFTGVFDESMQSFFSIDYSTGLWETYTAQANALGTEKYEVRKREENRHKMELLQKWVTTCIALAAFIKSFFF